MTDGANSIRAGAGLYESRIGFIPTMLTLIRKEASGDPETVAKARQWVQLGYVRRAATLAAWLASLKALSFAGFTSLLLFA